MISQLDRDVAEALGKSILVLPCIDTPHLVVGKHTKEPTKKELQKHDLVYAEHWKGRWTLGEFSHYEDGYVFLTNFYSPSTNKAQAMELLKRLLKKYCVSLEERGGLQNIYVDWDTQGIHPAVAIEEQGTLEIAICKAVIALTEKENERCCIRRKEI